jgi:hypothetical protein
MQCEISLPEVTLEGRLCQLSCWLSVMAEQERVANHILHSLSLNHSPCKLYASNGRYCVFFARRSSPF